MAVDYYLGEITMFAGNYAPRDWMFCDGSLLPVQQHTALFSLLGTTYGGDGVTNFKLPDLRDRFPIHRGDVFPLGAKGGSLTTQININNMPAHNHTLVASTQDATETEPQDNVLSVPQSRYPINVYAPEDPTKTTNMHENSIGATGGSEPLQVIPPFATVNFIICVDGVYPPRT